MTEPRRKPARVGRIIVASASTAATLGMVTGFAVADQKAPGAGAQAAAVPTAVPSPTKTVIYVMVPATGQASPADTGQTATGQSAASHPAAATPTMAAVPAGRKTTAAPTTATAARTAPVAAAPAPASAPVAAPVPAPVKATTPPPAPVTVTKAS